MILQSPPASISASATSFPTVGRISLTVRILRYRRLSIDPDRRVRAQSQHLMKALGVAAGKRISRQLSALMGPWLASQHDPAPDVAAAATAAFTTVFPKAEKRAKAVSVCFTSVTEHAYDYSSVQTVASLADSQSFTLDEHEKNELYVPQHPILNVKLCSTLIPL